MADDWQHLFETVAPGQVIGFVGSSGNSSGRRLHFEARVCERKQDPMLIAAIGWQFSQRKTSAGI